LYDIVDLLAPGYSRTIVSDRSYRPGNSGATCDQDDVTIRRARPADAAALAQLAVLDGDVIVAEVNGRLWAARSLVDARTLGDPFHPTAEARALLRLRAAHIVGISDGRSRARLRRRRLPALG
jgi:hypothetical protein